MAELYATYVSGRAEARELCVRDPLVVLRARAEQSREGARDKTPVEHLLDDLALVGGAVRDLLLERPQPLDQVVESEITLGGVEARAQRRQHLAEIRARAVGGVGGPPRERCAARCRPACWAGAGRGSRPAASGRCCARRP